MCWIKNTAGAWIKIDFLLLDHRHRSKIDQNMHFNPFLGKVLTQPLKKYNLFAQGS